MKNPIGLILPGLILISICIFLACGEKRAADVSKSPRVAPTKGDPAKALAREVINAMGGQEAWDTTRLLQWTFFGTRKWWWDKHTGMVRCEFPDQDLRVILDTDSKNGKLWIDGQMVGQQDTLDKYLDLAYRWWINDSYWLVMPFKLLDPGVNLEILGSDTTLAGANATVLEMTFENVGVTPDNKYHIYIDPATKYVVQWDFYRKATDLEPRFRMPWTNYARYGDLLLSDNRGNIALSALAVSQEVPENLFSDLAAPAGVLNAKKNKSQ